MTIDTPYLDQIRWNERGLVPVIAQDSETGEVLMMAWMNRDALAATISERRAVYWSRSRESLWRKGETSGHVQHVEEMRLDCDSDTLLIKVRQDGGIACHTGRRHCFMYRLDNGEWHSCEPVLRDPADIY